MEPEIDFFAKIQVFNTQDRWITCHSASELHISNITVEEVVEVCAVFMEFDFQKQFKIVLDFDEALIELDHCPAF